MAFSSNTYNARKFREDARASLSEARAHKAQGQVEFADLYARQALALNRVALCYRRKSPAFAKKEA